LTFFIIVFGIQISSLKVDMLGSKEKITPLVSIITPSYNQGQFLEQTIRSVISQDYPNIEYLVIDGGSTDNSVEIIKNYTGQIAYWVSCKDDGQAEAINYGFQRATGKYIAWLNSDDVYLPGCVQKAVDVLEANPDVGFVYGQVEVIDRFGKPISRFRPVAYTFKNLLTYKIIIPQQAAFFRNQVIQAVGGLDPQFHYALDHDLFVRIATQYSVKGFPDVVAQYRISSINKGVTHQSAWANEYVRILDKFYRQQPERQIYLEFWDQAYAGAYYRGACNLLDDGYYSSARQWYIQAASCHKPFLFRRSWWRNYFRTYLGKVGNEIFVRMKIWLAHIGLLNIEYDWWTSLVLKGKE